MVHIGLQEVREDHFRKVSPDQQSDGSIVITRLQENLREHSDHVWSILLSEVYRGCVLQVHLEAHVLVLCAACHVLAVRTTSHASVMQIVLRALAC